jgi:putative endonuclease
VKRLVYVEFHETMLEAIAREKQIKKWERGWKVELIERDNRRRLGRLPIGAACADSATERRRKRSQ